MGKTRQYNIEGVMLEIPLCYDELAGKEIEIFRTLLRIRSTLLKGVRSCLPGRMPVYMEKRWTQRHVLTADPAVSIGKRQTRCLASADINKSGAILTQTKRNCIKGEHKNEKTDCKPTALCGNNRGTNARVHFRS